MIASIYIYQYLHPKILFMFATLCINFFFKNDRESLLIGFNIFYFLIFIFDIYATKLLFLLLTYTSLYLHYLLISYFRHFIHFFYLLFYCFTCYDISNQYLISSSTLLNPKSTVYKALAFSINNLCLHFYSNNLKDIGVR